MGWASSHIEQLSKGNTVQFRPSGNSMQGIIESKQLVTVVPATVDTVNEGDVVLCRVSGAEYLHLVKAKDSQGRVQIGNNKGKINGWTKAVYGKCIKVES
jgi:hypothetical protein